jgi:hypothetical protein
MEEKRDRRGKREAGRGKADEENRDKEGRRRDRKTSGRIG